MTDGSVYLLDLSADMFVVVCVCACIQAHKHIPHEYIQAHMVILDPLALSMYAYEGRSKTHIIKSCRRRFFFNLECLKPASRKSRARPAQGPRKAS